MVVCRQLGFEGGEVRRGVSRPPSLQLTSPREPTVYTVSCVELFACLHATLQEVQLETFTVATHGGVATTGSPLRHARAAVHTVLLVLRSARAQVFGSSALPYAIASVSCMGTEQDLLDCAYYPTSFCSQDRAAGVLCSGECHTRALTRLLRVLP